MAFILYKGLKKPLVLFGLKDKYIYYALGFAITGILCVAFLLSYLGLFSVLLGAIIGIGGVRGVFYMQDKKGLYNKKRNENELYIFPKKFKKTNHKFLKK